MHTPTMLSIVPGQIGPYGLLHGYRDRMTFKAPLLAPGCSLNRVLHGTGRMTTFAVRHHSGGRVPLKFRNHRC